MPDTAVVQSRTKGRSRRSTAPNRPRPHGSTVPSLWNRKAPSSKSKARASIICAGAIARSRACCSCMAMRRMPIGGASSRRFSRANTTSPRWICPAWATPNGARTIRWSCSCSEQLAVCEDAGHVRDERAADHRGAQFRRLRHHADGRALRRPARRHGHRGFAGQSARPSGRSAQARRCGRTTSIRRWRRRWRASV